MLTSLSINQTPVDTLLNFIYKITIKPILSKHKTKY